MNERTNIRVSLRQAFLWLSIYAIVFSVLVVLSLTRLQAGAAAAVMTAFVVGDAFLSGARATLPRSAAWALTVAHFATAFAIAGLVALILHLVIPEPPAPPPPPPPFWAGLLDLVSGKLLSDIGAALGRAVAVIFAYYWFIGAFSALACAAGLTVRRDARVAKWYALINAPGVCLLGFLIVIHMLDAAGWQV